MARLPSFEVAIVEDSKLTGYIHNPDHRQGWPKGQLLVQLGFDANEPIPLKIAILAHARDNVIADAEITAFGTKYPIDGPLTSPTGRVAQIRTV